ncbi:hypothetical protein JCM11641_003644 [Rhodosporidiobolus odoratus]
MLALPGSDSAAPPRRVTRSSTSSTTSATLLAPALPLQLKPTKRTLAQAPSILKLELAQAGAGPAPQGGVEQAQPPPAKKRKKTSQSPRACLWGEPGPPNAELGLHYASPHNHFYKCLHAAQLTDRVLKPEESPSICEDWNVGITNLVKRPTRETSELSKEELNEGVEVLLRKVVQYRPRVVFFVGIKVGETVLRYFAALASSSSSAPIPSSTTVTIPIVTSTPKGKTRRPAPVKAGIGWQPFSLSYPADPSCSPSASSSAEEGRSKTLFYCLPSTSGRVAAYPLPTKLKIWATFGEEVQRIRSGEEVQLPQGMREWRAEALGLLVMPEREDGGDATGARPK